MKLSADRRQAQITHRLHSHDAITWLRNHSQLQPNLEDLKQRALIALDAANNTRLWQQDESPVAIRVLGAETEDNYLFIYLESEVASKQITHLQTSILMTLNSSQRNRVNVSYKDAQRSFEFAAKTPPQAVTVVLDH